ncbi:MAG: ABC transporter ATP-binding protein [Anaerolineae bacterium]|nr:ABC transporter ATP-binding protein [Anaerolineae bacterium]
MGAILQIRNLAIQRGERTVLLVNDLAVERGEVLAIIGPNGAGKSTLLLALALLLPPTSGAIWFDGALVTSQSNLTALRRRMAMVLQEPLLLDKTVVDNVALGLSLRGVGRAERERRAAVWLDRLGIAHLARRQARALSGGEAQRTSLARALALEPEVLFLDEPFSALDAPTRAGLVEQVAEIVRETGLTTVMVTHDRDEALALGDRVGVIMGGQLLQAGTPEEVFTTPVNAEVAQFVGVETVAPGHVIAQDGGLAAVQVSGFVVEAVSDAPLGQAVLACVRPEDVTILPDVGRGLTSARNVLRGRVTRLRPAGAQVRVTVDCGFPVTALITRRSAQELDLAVDQSVSASFKASAVHLILRAG